MLSAVPVARATAVAAVASVPWVRCGVLAVFVATALLLSFILSFLGVSFLGGPGPAAPVGSGVASPSMCRPCDA